MKITGIICEYNPLHLGHKKQIDLLKAQGSAVVCLMSGNFVQRGAPAIIDKSVRAHSAILCGADLVLEMPVTVSLSSAEGFASGSVAVLSRFCDGLCFGSETGDGVRLMKTAQTLLSAEFTEALRAQLDKGLSFPAARQAALEAMGADSSLLSQPNDILAVEYCKAILAQNSRMEPVPILRSGSYHDLTADWDNPSATAVRELMLHGRNWLDYIPAEAKDCFDGKPLHALSFGERAVLARLRTMSDADFEALPYGSEGLWRKLMHAARKEATLEGILTAVKSKRYTRTRLDRMVICAYLGITREMLSTPAPYVRVLAFNDTGRQILKQARLSGSFPNTGEAQAHPYQALEQRCQDLYALFCEAPSPAGTENERRVYYTP